MNNFKNLMKGEYDMVNKNQEFGISKKDIPFSILMICFLPFMLIACLLVGLIGLFRRIMEFIFGEKILTEITDN